MIKPIVNTVNFGSEFKNYQQKSENNIKQTNMSEFDIETALSKLPPLHILAYLDEDKFEMALKPFDKYLDSL